MSKGKPPRRGRPLNFGDFKYHDDHKLTLPILVLAIKPPDWAFGEESGSFYSPPKFKRGREWLQIAHQTAGLACHQHYMWATILKPKSVEIYQGMVALADKWYGTNTGAWGGPSLRAANEYASHLKGLLGVGCERSYIHLEEGLLPIDEEHVSALAEDSLPEDLDDLLEFESGWERAIGCIGRYTLWVLSENSD